MKAGHQLRVLALAGGVGGARLASGLAHVLGERLTVLVNTGDDFEHMGLHVSPDLDTVMYTLAGIANPKTGWGIADESWAFMQQAERLGGPDWFLLGDRDLATHVIRTQRLRNGESLTTITRDFCQALGIRSHVLPMTDDPVRTQVHSHDQTYDFQEYFVRLKCDVPVSRVSFNGAAEARFNPALQQLDPDGEPLVIIICPSNPYLSIDPILELPGITTWMKRQATVTIAVSPIVSGNAIKGPAAKIMRELGLNPSAVAVAHHYREVVDGFVFDESDAGLTSEIQAVQLATCPAQTVMRTMDDRIQLAETCLEFARRLMQRGL